MIRRILTLMAVLALPLTLWFVRRSQRKALVPQPRGMVLGLYAGVPDYDYARGAGPHRGHRAPPA